MDDSWVQVSTYSAAQLWPSTPSYLSFVWKYHVEGPQSPSTAATSGRRCEGLRSFCKLSVFFLRLWNGGELLTVNYN